MKNFSICAAAVGASLFVACGCGEKRPYTLAPVSGVVTFDGEPAAGASVVFQPRATGSSKSPGPGSTAFCDDAGRYELETMREESGAVVGKHRVEIFGPRQEGSDDLTEKYPGRYNVNSQLTFDVSPEGTTNADFQLTSKSK